VPAGWRQETTGGVARWGEREPDDEQLTDEEALRLCRLEQERRPVHLLGVAAW